MPVEDDHDDGPWYLGRARDEFNKRQRGQEMNRIDQEDDPVQVISFFRKKRTTGMMLNCLQWARDRKNAEAEREAEFGPEDYFDAATRGRRRDVEDLDESTETFLLVFLFITVSLLLYVRGRWVERMRRDEEQRQQQREGGVPNQGQPPVVRGLFPLGEAVRDN